MRNMTKHHTGRVVALALTGITAAAAITGCGASEETAASEDGGGAKVESVKGLTIGVSNLGLNAPFPAAISRGIKAEAQRQGIEIVELDGKSDPDKQANDVQDLIARKPAGLLLLPVDSGVAQGLVNQASEAGIPTVAVASQVGDPKERPLKDVYPKLVALATQDEVGAGAKAAEIAAKVLPDGGEMAVLEGQAGFAEVKLRQQGFDEGLAKSGVKFDVVASQPGDWTAEKGQAACQNMLAAQPRIKLIYSHSDDMAVGCVKAVRQANRDVKVIAVGGSKLAMKEIEAGRMSGTVCYKPENLGVLALQTLAKHLTGEATAEHEFVSYDTPAITKENVDDCDPQW
ncbi:sugar ABC transporter substrate-binding protein [Patulibacter sp. S7RM1-6]